MKKKLILIILWGMFLLVGFIFLLYSPAVANDSITNTVFDKEYFNNKFSLEPMDYMTDFDLILTEEEINGYLHFQITHKDFSLETHPLNITHINVDVLPGGLILNLYGNLYSLPVKIQSHLKPFYEDEVIYFYIEKVKFSRIRLPKKFYPVLIEKTLGNSIPLTEGSYFAFELDLPDFIKLKDIRFYNKEIIFHYQLLKDKLLDELLKDLGGE